MAENIGPGRVRQAAIYRSGISGIRPSVPTSWPALVARAERRMSREGFAYLAGGAGSESTIFNNRNGFDEWQIVAESIPMVFSNQASRSMEDCAAVMGDSPRWFQLYWSTVDDLVESFVKRAEACGCAALVVTLDTTMLGWRSRDLDLASLPFAHGWGIAQYTSDPVFQALVAERVRAGQPFGEDKPKVTTAAIRTLLDIARAHPGSARDNLRSPVPRAAVQTFLDIYSRPSITWANLAWLRARTRLPIILKGVLHPDDARLALDHGVDGLIVSTHGGRQVDGSIGAVQALPGVVEAVGARVPVLMDSGIRGGADVFKAVNLGADAVLIGRAWAYGLAIAGWEGARDVIRNIIGELDLTMGLTGCASLDDVRDATLRRG